MFFYLALLSMCRSGTDMLQLALMVPGILTPHFCIEFRKHFTKIHVTVVGFFGATELLIIIMGAFLFGFFYSQQVY